jgi:probable F420-dependent oxidoreductase
MIVAGNGDVQGLRAGPKVRCAAMEFGIQLHRMDDIAGSARRCEELGYDYVSTGEHVFFHVPTPNAFISLAVAAGATERIRLMSTITLAPLYPAALLAKLAASLDVASEGRFTLGIGIGGEYAREFEACGVPVAERGPRTDEALEVMERLFTGERVDFDGRFTTLRGVALMPAPVQQPRLPVWVAGRGEGAWRRAARYADGWLPYMYTPEMVADSAARIGAMRSEAGRSGPVTTGAFLFFAVHEDGATAVDMVNARLSKQYNQDFTRLVPKYAVAGAPDDCIARLRDFVDAGVTTFVLAPACPVSYTDTAIDLMSSAVLPALRSRR